MPFIGLGIHILVALFFAIHAIRRGQELYWLIILFTFPLLGSIVYFLAVYLPETRLERGARKTVAAVARSLDPTRELREARAAFEYTATAQNQMRLAKALLESGAIDEAADNYEACLQGPFASDPEIKFLAARALLESHRYANAVARLEELLTQNAKFKPEQTALLLGRALAGAGRQTEALATLNDAVSRFGSFEAQAELAICAYCAGDFATAERLQHDLDQAMQRWSKHTRDINAELVRRLNAAKASKPVS